MYLQGKNVQQSNLDPQLVPRTTAIAIGLRDEPQRLVIDMLCDYLHEKRMHLILDNCEHLVDACARMADRILHAAHAGVSMMRDEWGQDQIYVVIETALQTRGGQPQS